MHLLLRSVYAPVAIRILLHRCSASCSFSHLWLQPLISPPLLQVLYGRVGTYKLRTVDMHYDDNTHIPADLKLWRTSAASIVKHVIRPWSRGGTIPVDVFAHSFNPELGAVMKQRYSKVAAVYRASHELQVSTPQNEVNNVARYTRARTHQHVQLISSCHRPIVLLTCSVGGVQTRSLGEPSAECWDTVSVQHLHCSE